MKTRIGILTGGGDCSGLNAVISSVVRAGSTLGYEFVGFEDGWEGVLDPVQYRELDIQAVSGISHLGGTILRTTNRGRFAGKTGEGGVSIIPNEILEMAARNLRKLHIEGLIVIGGDGTLSAALQLAEYTGVNLVGVPKTIDNDLESTDQTFGFSTAVQVATEALDKVHTTAASHTRVLFVETMGRHAGWIALHAGLAGNAHAILLPEFTFSLDKLVQFLRQRHDNKQASIVVVAEGIRIPELKRQLSSIGASEVALAGVSQQLIHAVEQLAPNEFEMRAVILGHIQRGGTPNHEDRILAKRYGVAAIETYQAGKFGSMVALRHGQMVAEPIKDAVSGLKRVNSETPELVTARKIGLFV